MSGHDQKQSPTAREGIQHVNERGEVVFDVLNHVHADDRVEPIVDLEQVDVTELDIVASDVGLAVAERGLGDVDAEQRSHILVRGNHGAEASNTATYLQNAPAKVRLEELERPPMIVSSPRHSRGRDSELVMRLRVRHLVHLRHRPVGEGS